jgi:hypothetical protein
MPDGLDESIKIVMSEAVGLGWLKSLCFIVIIDQ